MGKGFPRRIGQGRENAKQFMKDNPTIAMKLENQIRANAGVVANAMLAGPESAAEAAEATLDDTANDQPAAKGKKTAAASAG